ncbi:MAG: glycosyltransferase family 2 protein [Bacteroidota bacterium]
MTNTPLVSVLMPVYNGEKYLKEAIDSILNQTFTDFEFLIINDGSTDTTEQIILSYEDPRIRYAKNETNLKLIATLNKGIKLCKGRYIVRMDSDDISALDRIEKQVAFMEEHPDVGFSGTWFETFDEMGIKGTSKYACEHDEICFKHLYQIHLSHGTAIFRKSILDKLNFQFDTEYAHAEDYDLFTRMSLETKLANLPFVGCAVRHHQNEVSVKFGNIQRANSLRVRNRLFDLLDTESDEKLLIAFQELNQQDYQSIDLSDEQTQKMLESLILGNRKTNYIQTDYFESQIKTLWLNYCYHKTSFKTYKKSSILFDKKLVQTVSKPKWFLKSILN